MGQVGDIPDIPPVNRAIMARTQAARLLSITRVTVWNRMKKHGIDLKRVLSV